MGTKMSNYILRDVVEGDFEQLKQMLLKNSYLKMLWNLPELSDGTADDIIKSVYMKQSEDDSEKAYCIEDKETSEFIGYLSICMDDDSEGELSIRLVEEADLQEIMGLFGKLLSQRIGGRQSNLTMQFCLD